MEPITILIYVAIAFLLIVGIMLSMVLYRLLRILTKVDRITSFAAQVSGLLELWGQLPMKFLEGALERLFEKRK